jgi:hypothetical protein
MPINPPVGPSGESPIPEFAGLEHMTQEHYAGFGLVVHLTSHLDALLDQIIVAMTNTANHPTFYPLLTFLSAKDKRDYIVAIAREAAWPPYAIKGMVDLMGRTKSAFSLRNDIAHCVWRPGRRKGAIKPMQMSARSVVKLLGSDHNEREWTASQLIAEAHKIYQVGIDLGAFMRSYGLFPTLPEKPPSQPRATPDRKTDMPHQDD